MLENSIPWGMSYSEVEFDVRERFEEDAMLEWSANESEWNCLDEPATDWRGTIKKRIFHCSTKPSFWFLRSLQ